MDNKWGRYYSLQIETLDQEVIEAQGTVKTTDKLVINNVTITSPLTLKFDVTRHNLADANSASFEIYNLSEATRNRIFKDPWATADKRAIQLTAGYQRKGEKDAIIGMIFNGEMRSAMSFRRGTEWVTEIEAFNGAFAMANGTISESFAAGTTTGDLMRSLAAAMPGVKNVAIGKDDNKIKRAVELMGNAAQLIQEIANGKFSIDGDTAYVLKDYECVNGDIQVINTDSGLIGVPRRAKNFIELDMFFEPRLKINQWVRLESRNIAAAVGGIPQAARALQGEYKVIGLTHKGTISDAVCEDLMTTVSLQLVPNKDIVEGFGV